MRAHYREAAAAGRAIGKSASSEQVRSEAEWLIRVYDHVAAHFDDSLREGFGPAAAASPDPSLEEFTNPASIADVATRERIFAHQIAKNHERLFAFVHGESYAALALRSELLREIRLDIETSQTSQVQAFCSAVEKR
jgi:hypothetical protein